MKKGYITESIRREILEKDGYICFRVSGSIGGADLIAIKKMDNTYDIRLEQIKKSSKPYFYFNERSKSEWEYLRKIKEKTGIKCFFIFRMKSNGRYAWGELEVSSRPPKKIYIDKNLMHMVVV